MVFSLAGDYTFSKIVPGREHDLSAVQLYFKSGPGALSCSKALNNEYHAGGCTMAVYRIRLKERLDEHWSSWLGGLKVVHEANGETMLIGEVVDQAALHGLLSKVRDLQLTLLSVSSLEEESFIKQAEEGKPMN
jgi:hypothetical protein